jgi:four helix bundle protein
MANIRSFRELRVYRNASDAAMRIFNLTKCFPAEEKFSMVDQMRRSSRAVCSNLAEAWRKRRYSAHFVSKLTDSKGEADETRVWLEFALASGYIPQLVFDEVD